MLSKLLAWFHRLSETPKEAFTGVVLGVLGTIFVAFLTILCKDYYIPILAERRAAKKKKNGAFRAYSTPIISSSSALLYRLDEILNYRGRYLLSTSPKTPFNQYKYISTIYRLCALMGWMRASNIEFSNIEVKNTAAYQQVRSGVNNIEMSLADGQHVEEKVLVKLCSLVAIDIATLNNYQKKVLASKVEDWIDSFCYSNDAISPFSLSDKKKGLLVRHVVDQLCQEMKIAPKRDHFFSSQLITDCITNMDWKEGLVYRDWQSAIGDLMLKANTGGDRRFDIISYKEFEDMYHATDKGVKKWIERSEKLFKDLNVAAPPPFDVRPEQLTKIFIAAYELLDINFKLSGFTVDIAKDTLQRFSPTYESLCLQIQKKPMNMANTSRLALLRKKVAGWFSPSDNN